MAIYMKWDGIDGAVTTKEHEKWIELNSFQFGVGRAIGTAARGAATREASEPHISEITISKRLDKASTKLFMDAVAGDLSSTVKFSDRLSTGAPSESADMLWPLTPQLVSSNAR